MFVAVVSLAVVLTVGALAEAQSAGSDTDPSGAVTPPPAAHRPGAPLETYVLDNGLEVALAQDTRIPRVAVAVAYRVGSRDDPAGYRGLAHLTEHLMFEGLRDEEHASFFEYLQDGGSTDANATTELDQTTYFEEVPRESLDLALWLESTRMAFLLEHIDKEDVERARAAVLNEYELRFGGGGYGALAALTAAETYPEGHPARRLADNPDDIEAITLRDVQWFFQRFYSPANARLVLVGDFEREAARSMIARRFGRVKKRGTIPVPPPDPATSPSRRIVEADWPLKNHVCMRLWPVAGNDPAQRAALDVLSNHAIRLLRHRLVRERGVALALFGSHQEHQRASEVSLVVAFDPKQPRTSVFKPLDVTLKQIREAGMSQKAVTEAKRRLRRQAHAAQQGLVRRAVGLSRGLKAPTRGRFEAWAAQLSKVSVADVQRAAQRWLSPRGRTQVCMNPKAHTSTLGEVTDRSENSEAAR